MKLLVLSLLSLAAVGTADKLPGTQFLVELSLPSGSLPSDFGLHDFDRRVVDNDHNDFHVFASSEDLDVMKAQDLPFSVVETSKPLYEKFPNHTFPDRDLSAFGFPSSPPPGYRNRAQIMQFLDTVVQQFPNIAELVDLSVYGPSTYQDRYMSMIKISDNVSIDEDENNIIVVAAHHCRELVTPEIVMNIIAQLTSQYNVDPEITRIVNENQIYLIPVVNVDGYEYVFTVDDFWRKNLKFGHGVDINRNYDLGWDGPAGGSTQTGSNTYRGAFPLSEEESTTIINFERERNVAKIIDFHSSGREVLPAYRAEPIAEEVYDYNWAIGTELANVIGYATRTPSADGEHQQQGIREITTFGWLVETSNQFQPPFDEALQEVARVFPLALRFLSYPVPLSGHVRSSVGIAVQATLSVDDFIGPGTYHTRQTDSRYGRYHLFLGQGTYQVTFSANGHLSETRTVTVAGTPVTLDVTLQLQAAVAM